MCGNSMQQLLQTWSFFQSALTCWVPSVMTFYVILRKREVFLFKIVSYECWQEIFALQKEKCSPEVLGFEMNFTWSNVAFHCIFPVWGFFPCDQSLAISEILFAAGQIVLLRRERGWVQLKLLPSRDIEPKPNENKRAQSWQSLCKEGIPRKNGISVQTKPRKNQTKTKSTYSIEKNIHQNCIKPNHSPIPVLKASQQAWSRSRSHKEHRVFPVYENLTSISFSLVQLPNNIYLPQAVFFRTILNA